MTDRNLFSEQERASMTVTRCELQLRQAEEAVRCAGEGLRRAIRTAKTAEAELDDAVRRLDRMALPMKRVG